MFKGTKGFVVADFELADPAALRRRRRPDLLQAAAEGQGAAAAGPLPEAVDRRLQGPSLKTACDFEYSGNMIEQMLLGLVAYRVGKKLDYDGAAGRVTNCPEANDLEPPVPPGLDARRVRREPDVSRRVITAEKPPHRMPPASRKGPNHVPLWPVLFAASSVVQPLQVLYAQAEPLRPPRHRLVREGRSTIRRLLRSTKR